jgi:hypothetical protein
MKHQLVLACVMAMWGTASAADPILTPDGLGPVKIGSSLAALQNALGQRIDIRSKDCVLFADPGRHRPGVSYMIEERRVTRIGIDYYRDSNYPLTVRTLAGVGLGSTEDEVIKAYGDRVRVEPYDGDPSWHHLYVDEPDHSRGIAFDTDGKKVKSMRIGEYPSLRYTEGCR